METVTVNAKGAKRIQFGHPWVFKSDLRDFILLDSSASGGLARIVRVNDPKGKYIADAFYSPRSQIAIRIIQSAFFGGMKEINAEFWRAKILDAFNRKKSLEKVTNAIRVIFGEADGIPSVIIDRYNDVFVLQTLSTGAETIKQTLFNIIEGFRPRTIVERNDAPVRKLENLEEISRIVSGKDPKAEIKEGDQIFLADTILGQKTGAFLDQRSNRLAVENFASGRCLDCFCYQGWFACHMAKKADSVTAVDVSAPALEFARQNALKNGHKNIQTVEANVFNFLRANKDEKFDFILLDPPAFVKNRSSLADGVRGYKEINLRAIKLLKNGGCLMTSSCSQHLSREEFIAILHSASVDAGKSLHIVYQGHQDIDHPILLSFPESEYLKTVVLKVVS